MIASLFILGGVNKIINFDQTLVSMSAVGLHPTLPLLILTIVLELGGGLVIASGQRFYVVVALLLACFTIATNFIFHNFWALEDPVRSFELALFFKNVVIAGALIFIAGFGMQKSPDS